MCNTYFLKGYGIIIIAILTQTVRTVDYGPMLVPEQGRPIPPELLLIFANKSHYEQEIEECMVEYSKCVSITAFRNQWICAMNLSGKEKEFLDMCDMAYENCKHSESWSYFRDDKC